MYIDIIKQENIKEAVRLATDVMIGGGVILYPTDTVYGLGVCSNNQSALKKLSKIKEINPEKNLLNIVSSLESCKKYAEIDDIAIKLANAFLPGPLALILKKLPNANTIKSSTIGIRIPNHKFCLDLAEHCSFPYTSTSANITKKSTGQSIEQVLIQLGDNADLIDLIIDQGTIPISKPSTIVDLTGDDIIIVRAGAIEESEIKQVLSG